MKHALIKYYIHVYQLVSTNEKCKKRSCVCLRLFCTITVLVLLAVQMMQAAAIVYCMDKLIVFPKKGS